MIKEKNEKGKTFAYIRVSSIDQNLEAQRAKINDSNFVIDKFFEDKVSGKDIEREGFKRLFEIVREDDWIIVSSLDRISRSLVDLVKIIKDVNEKNLRLISLRENFDFSTNTGKFLFGIFANLAEYERNIIRERQRDGIALAKISGKYKGRKKIQIPNNFEVCFDKYQNSNRVQKYTLDTFAKDTSLTKSTLYKLIKEKLRENKKQNI